MEPDDGDFAVLHDEAAVIRDVFTYAHRFVGSAFVFRVTSKVVYSPHFPGFVRDLSLLHENGIKICVVPSGSERIDQLLASYGIETERVKGIRISPPEAMPIIQMAAFDTAIACINQFARHKVEALVGNWVRARAIGVRDGVDFMDTGLVENVHADLIRRSLEDGFVPVLPCIGWNAIGKPYNISSLELATRLATSLNATKLFLITEGEPFSDEGLQSPREGVVSREGYLSRISVQAAEALVTDWPELLEPGELDMLGHAVEACRGGVERVHFLDGTMDGVVLKEVFSTLGYGIMVHVDPFEHVRPMKDEDIVDVLGIMEAFVRKGILVRRSEEDMQRLRPDFVVYETDGTIRGCGALHRYGPDQAEIAGIAVDENFGRMGVGRKVVEFLLEEARRKKLSQVFLLTTKTSDWFQSLGFTQGSADDLPPERRATYDERRKSRVFVYPLADRAAGQ
ncbi:MAG: amino-acid N-acetyltransferase [Treponema sp.]|nr:amino-acid N-acetyltransferase [Treponema sp.]